MVKMNKRQMFLIGTTLVVLSLGLLFAGCGADDGVGDSKGPFGGITETTKYTFNSLSYDGIPTNLVSGQVDTVTVSGREFPVYQVKNTAAGSDEGVMVFADWQPTKVVFAGGQVYWKDNGVTLPGEPFISGTTDKPVTIDIDPPIGQVNTVPVKGSAYVGDPTNPANLNQVDVVATYTLDEVDVTVDTAMGAVSGCKKFSGYTEYMGQVVNGVAYYHPDHGLVKGSIDWPPPNGSTLDMSGVFDSGENGDGFNAIRMMTVIDSANPSFSLDTYDVNGEFDADEHTHAKMLLEMRWADATMAMDPSSQPAVNVEFGTTWGYYPHMLLPSPVSFFHPEENGKGYTFWWAYVSQADKYSSEHGITYHVNGSLADGSVAPVQITARIIYKKIQ